MLTRGQVEAIYKLWRRIEEVQLADAYGCKPPTSYLQFRRTAIYADLLGCVMIPWCGMVVGIESDGYAHT